MSPSLAAERAGLLLAVLEEATADLSQACVACGRNLNSLPPLAMEG